VLKAAVVLLLILVLGPEVVVAQQPGDSVYYVDSLVPSLMRIEHKPMRAGAHLSYGLNTLDSTGPLPSSIAQYCELDRDGNGRSIQGGLHVEYPLWGDFSSFSYYGSIGFRNTSFTSIYEGQFESAEGPQIVTSEIYHRSLGISFAPLGLVFEPIRQLRFTINPELDFFFSKRYEKLQTVSPGIWKEGGQVRSVGAAATPEARFFNAALRTTLGYEVPLSRVLFAEPQIGAVIPLLGTTPYWYSARVEAGISFHYDLTPRFETIPVNDVIKVPRYVKRVEPAKPKLHATISAVGISRDGTQSPVLKMSVEEVRSRNAYPILTYVFFDENSATIPTRYVQYASRAQAEREFKGAETRENIKPLELYREVLNVLGARLSANRNAKVRLIGTLANVGSESGKLELAKSRAQAVKDYLVQVWGIAASRISIESKLDPEKPSPNTTEQGRAENRRVEILIDQDEVTDPVTVLNIERLATPDRINLRPDITADAGIMSLRGAVLTGDEELMVITQTAERSSTTKPWIVTEENISRFKDSLTLRLDVVDSVGSRYTAFGSIPISIDRNTADKPERIERFSLILFDFDESRIEAKNGKLITRVAKALPGLNAERITIIGHTDETGNADYNDRLSRQRAEAAKLALEKASEEQGLSISRNIVTDGRGSREALFDNTLPEGRFYSRTVNITVEKRK
jgi:outer membrane protein OmpA-like peptidoglycan-associated protein